MPSYNTRRLMIRYTPGKIHGKKFSNINFLGIALSVVLFLHICPFQPVAADALNPVEVALGNWAPVVEERRVDHGALIEKITIVLRRMGYQPTYSFMPWGQAQDKVASNETDSGPRVTFPYLKTASREADFLYSDKPVFQACMKFLYNKDKIRDSAMTRLKTLDDLRHYRIGYVAESAGFQYPKRLKPFLQKQGKHFPGLYESFEALIDNNSDVQVVPTVRAVGEHLLIELFPEARDKIVLLQEPNTGSEDDCMLPVDYYLLVSRKNPNNAEFMDRFNQEYGRLEADKETVARINRREAERGSLRHPLVSLGNSCTDSRILAETQNGRQIDIPHGTKGLLLDWADTVDAEDSSSHTTATVRLISGPYRGMTIRLSGGFLRLE